MAVLEILEQAFQTFDEGDYDSAVKAFFAASVASNDEQQISDIYQVLYENFIKPNEEEFRETYASSIEKIKSNNGMNIESTPSFDELALRAIPVSDTRFYIWDVKSGRPFSGKALDLEEINNRDREDILSPLLMDGITDMNVVLGNTAMYQYSRLYFVYRDSSLLVKFLSYFMIPGVVDCFPMPIHIFDDLSIFKTFMLDSGAYIPRRIKCVDSYDYSPLISEIHEERINGKRQGNNVFLSICMPSWNRGQTALENIKRLLRLVYDEEIEIILCNNGSTKELEYYKEIEDLSKKDTRLIYKELPSRYYGDSFENAISIPIGKHALFCGDEDIMVLENFDQAIECVYRNRDVGVHCFVTATTTTSYYETDPHIVNEGFNKVVAALFCNYLTGLCFNMEIIRREQFLPKFHERYNNGEFWAYYNCYTHSVYSAYISNCAGMHYTNIILFEDLKGGDVFDENGNLKIRYIYPENRAKHLEGQINILWDMGLDVDTLTQCVLNMGFNIYRLLRSAYGYYMDIMIEKYSWEEACRIIYTAEDNLFGDERMIECVGESISKDMKNYAWKWYLEESQRLPERYEDEPGQDMDDVFVEGE